MAAVLSGFWPLTFPGCSPLSCASNCSDEQRRREGEEFVPDAPCAPDAPWAPQKYSNLRLCARKADSPTNYSAERTAPMCGVPIREGPIWDVTESVAPGTLSLYVNGFAFTGLDDHEKSSALSPFSVVRACKFASGVCDHLKCFRVAFDADNSLFFGIKSISAQDAEDERSSLILAISHVILLITDSLLPSIPMSCDSVEGVVDTRRRLLAGYLLYKDGRNSVAVVFIQLSAQDREVAQLAVYADHQCQQLAMDIPIAADTDCAEKIGVNSSCFIIGDHEFACRNLSERKVWLRAIGNVKVKLDTESPAPSDDELVHYRSAIREYMEENAAVSEPVQLSREPLLPKRARSPGSEISRVPRPLKGDDVTDSFGEAPLPMLSRVPAARKPGVTRTAGTQFPCLIGNSAQLPSFSGGDITPV